MGKKVNNLLDKHKIREGDGAYYNFEQVKQTTQNYQTLIQSYSNKNGWMINSLVDNLENLKLILESQERTFYNELGLSGPQSIKILQEKVDKWRDSGANAMLQESFITQVSQQIKIEIDQAQLTAALEKILNNPKTQEEQVEVLLNEDVKVWELLNSVFGKEGKGSYSNAKTSSLNASLEIKKNNDKFIVSQKSGTELSNAMRYKLAKDINTYSDEQKIDLSAKEWENLSLIIYNLLKSHISETEVLQCIYYELRNRKKDDYNRLGEFLMVKGWLAEMYWNGCMSYLFGSKGASTPVGKKLNTSGKQLSVDIILNSCGFQVKSWKIKEGKHTTSYKRQLGNFLETRADLLNSFVGDIIAQMFGTISYNKPTDEEEYKGENFQEYANFYNSQVKPVENQLNQLEQVFLTRLNKIITIDNGGRLKDSVFNQEREFYNTFWLINDKIIPSSVIIAEMISVLKNDFSMQTVTFNLTNLTDKGGPVWPNPTNTTPKAMANRWTINYDITFDLDWLLQKTLQKV